MIFETDNYLIKQNDFYRFVPGFYQITLKNDIEYNDVLINELSKLEYLIRKFMRSRNIELVGIYREQDNDSKLKILVIPYYLNILQKLNIDPDLYQPYITKYLNSFDSSFDIEQNNLNKELKEFLNREINNANI